MKEQKDTTKWMVNPYQAARELESIEKLEREINQELETDHPNIIVLHSLPHRTVLVL
uniref:Uncharacterized protein n=2 Tax=viral metagenome TaxID=1070528 RepID=A0A6M3Y258_9ZZZZ